MGITEDFEALLDLAIDEDLSKDGDVTSAAIFAEERAEAVLYSKGTGVLAGSEYVCRVYDRIDSTVSVTFEVSDGDHLDPGIPIARISGPVISILSGERIALNFLSYLSGIATGAHRFSTEARRFGSTVILDTRKTLPGFRRLAKYAVRTGGAKNHRMGLYDMILIKDNHIDAAGSVTSAVRKVRDRFGTRFSVEVECRTADEVSEAVAAGADIIMLDNMSVQEAVSALEFRRDPVTFEISGNMDLRRIREYAAIGADFISVGKLTHSVEAFDFSLRIAVTNQSETE
jgi:nicotinate-nucleotide pyrophosphorylase (carboxylating)